MCVITTSVTAGTLATIGLTSAAASTAAVAATTVAANMIVGAALGAGISAATGARGKDLWRSALIGGAGAGLGSGLGMALGGISTVTTTASNAGASVVTQTANTGGLLAEASVGAPTTVINGETFVLAGEGASAHWVPAAAGASTEATTAMLASSALQAGGSAVEAYGNYREGKEEAAFARQQARLSQIRAAQEMDAAAVEKIDLARRQRQNIGRGRAAAAANGVMLEARAESSPAIWEQDAKAELAYEGAKIDYNANMAAWGHNTNAAVLYQRAKSARRTGNLKAGTSLLRGGVGVATSLYGRNGTSLFA